jgi:hypothetical protein
MTPAAALLLALAVPAAPAAKADRGLPKDLVDLIPEDTAGVLVIDVPKVARSAVGQAILKAIAAAEEPGEPLRVTELLGDAELLVVSQFLIDTGFGDFCILARLKEKSDVPKALVARADKAGKDTAPETIGKRTVYSLDGAGASFALIDGRTVMLVLATGNDKQIRQTRAAAYSDREKPGPRPALRKMLADDGKDPRAVRLYGSHPTKLALSTWLVLAAFGLRDEPVQALGDKVVSYRGGVKEGDAAEIEIRITLKDAAAAGELLKLYEQVDNRDPFVRDLRASGKAVRDGDDVVVTAKLTPGMIELAKRSPNK